MNFIKGFVNNVVDKSKDIFKSAKSKGEASTFGDVSKQVSKGISDVGNMITKSMNISFDAKKQEEEPSFGPPEIPARPLEEVEATVPFKSETNYQPDLEVATSNPISTEMVGNYESSEQFGSGEQSNFSQPVYPEMSDGFVNAPQNQTAFYETESPQMESQPQLERPIPFYTGDETQNEKVENPTATIPFYVEEEVFSYEPVNRSAEEQFSMKEMQNSSFTQQPFSSEPVSLPENEELGEQSAENKPKFFFNQPSSEPTSEDMMNDTGFVEEMNSELRVVGENSEACVDMSTNVNVSGEEFSRETPESEIASTYIQILNSTQEPSDQQKSI